MTIVPLPTGFNYDPLRDSLEDYSVEKQIIILIFKQELRKRIPVIMHSIL